MSPLEHISNKLLYRLALELDPSVELRSLESDVYSDLGECIEFCDHWVVLPVVILLQAGLSC